MSRSKPQSQPLSLVEPKTNPLVLSAAGSCLRCDRGLRQARYIGPKKAVTPDSNADALDPEMAGHLLLFPGLSGILATAVGVGSVLDHLP